MWPWRLGRAPRLAPTPRDQPCCLGRWSPKFPPWPTHDPRRALPWPRCQHSPFEPATLGPCLGCHWGAMGQVVPRGTPLANPLGHPCLPCPQPQNCPVGTMPYNLGTHQHPTMMIGKVGALDPLCKAIQPPLQSMGSTSHAKHGSYRGCSYMGQTPGGMHEMGGSGGMGAGKTAHGKGWQGERGGSSKGNGHSPGTWWQGWP